MNVSNSRIRVLALKKAEQSDDVIVRLVELDGKPAQNVRIAFAAPITAAREVTGQEEPVGNASPAGGALVTSFTPYQLHTFAVKLGPSRAKAAPPQSQPVTLSYDQPVATQPQGPSQSGFDSQGHSLPAEMLPTDIAYNGIHFNLAAAGDGKPNAVAAKGQTIQLPGSSFNRVYVLAASADGDQKASFRAGDKAIDLTIHNWGGYIGQWDNRTWNKHEEQIPPRAGAPAG